MESDARKTVVFRIKEIEKMFRLKLMIVAAVLLSTAAVHAAEPGSASISHLVSALRSKAPLDFCGEPVPRNIPEIRERLERELLLILLDRAQAIIWLKRTNRYLPHIEAVLKENGMPTDLKYLAVVESSLLPHSGSPKGAIGYWQFIPDTGRRYGLIINERKDERRNFYASTRAAIAYLKDLYGMFGSWTLAAAAYNMGERGLTAEIMVQQTRNYYELYMPLETQRYVFRILAVKQLLTSPEKFGIELDETDLYTPEPVETVEIECPGEISITTVAQAAGVTFKKIKDLNPELRGHYLAPGKHTIRIPKGGAKEFHAKYRQAMQQRADSPKERVYVVQKGDNLSLIAERFKVPLAAILIWNRLDPRRAIHPGERLIVQQDLKLDLESEKN
jgi:soluble lytic murein transglycosylase-like protein